jgi:D-glycero-alpha-D-manno-heptose-7-phosphate kinase
MTLFARAPLRIDFAGGWTDLPSFADVEGGAAVNAAITLYQHVEAILGDKRIRLHAIDTDQRVTLPSSREITYDGSLDAHKAALNMLPVTGGIEIFTKSDAPEGADLGETAALEVALLAVLARARGEQYDADELAEFGHLLETQELKQLGARQDQCAAAHGGVQALRFSSEGARTRPLPLTPEQLTDLAEHLVLLYTGHSHLSAAAKARVSGACEAGDTAILDALRRMRDLAAEAEAAFAGADWQALAAVVDAHWREQQQVDATIATERTRAIEEMVRGAGAWGLKGAGAGAGGCLVVVVPPSRRSDVIDAATREDVTVLSFGFAHRGVDVWESPTGSVA